MKYFLVLIFLGALGFAIFYKIHGPIVFKPEKQLFEYNLKEEDKEVAKVTNYQLVKFLRGDVALVVCDNIETQIFHIFGTICPSLKSSENKSATWGKYRTREQLAKIAKEALKASNDWTTNEAARFSKRTERKENDLTIVEGDVITPDGESLSQVLLSRGLGLSDDTTGRGNIFEEEAINAEIGLWAHPLPPEKRLFIEANMAQTILDRQSHAQKASMTSDILERSKSEERQAVIGLELKATPPIYRPYKLTIDCFFQMMEAKGSDETGEVTQASDTEKISEEVLLSTESTNLIFRSSPYEMSLITRGGRDFRQGIFCSRCRVVVYCDEEQIFEDEKKF